MIFAGGDYPNAEAVRGMMGTAIGVITSWAVSTSETEKIGERAMKYYTREYNEVKVGPPIATPNCGGEQRYIATVTGKNNHAQTVTATSTADKTKSATATVTVPRNEGLEEEWERVGGASNMGAFNRITFSGTGAVINTLEMGGAGAAYTTAVQNGFYKAGDQWLRNIKSTGVDKGGNNTWSCEILAPVYSRGIATGVEYKPGGINMNEQGQIFVVTPNVQTTRYQRR